MNKKFLVLILLMSLILISCKKETKYEINGFQFESLAKDFHRITLTVEKDGVKTIYNVNIKEDPRTLKDIPMDSEVKDKILKSNQIYIAMNPNANYSGKVTMAGIEIKKFISNPLLWNKNSSAAFTEPYPDMDFKIKKCEDNETVILLKTGDEDKIYYDKCVIVQGKDEDGMIRSADRLVLSLLGVY